METKEKMKVSQMLESMGPVTEGDLIPILQRVQDEYGYLRQDVLLEISKLTGIAASRIYGVATFYEQFYLEPHGRHTIKCCRGTACHVKGGQQVIDSICRALGVDESGTTEDVEFTFETVACLGVCALAPVMMIDDVYFGKMTSAKVGSVLDSVRTSGKEKA